MILVPVLFIILVFWLLFRPSPRPRRMMDSAPQPEPPKPPPPRLSLVTSNIRERTAGEDPDGAVCELSLIPGREVFTPPLPKGKRLKLHVKGTCGVKPWNSGWYEYDACYSADTNDHNYKHRHHKLLLDGKVPAKAPIEEDRHTHSYAYLYEATGNRLSVLLEPLTYVLWDAAKTRGSIRLRVLPLTATEELALGIEGIFAPERLREQEERKQQEARSKQALELAVKAHLEKNFLDAQYQQRYAKRHIAKILHTDSREWLQEYQHVIGDPALYVLIEEQHPHIMPFLEARLEIVRIAERLAVAPEPTPPAPEPPPKKTPDEKRTADLNWFRVTTTDYRQKAMLRLAVEQEFLADLQKKFPNLTEQELRRELQKFRDEAVNDRNDGPPPGIKTF